MRAAVVAVPSLKVWQPQDDFHETSPKPCFFLCSSSFRFALFRACLDYDTSRQSLHCQGQQAAVFEVPSKPNYSMTPTGVCHGMKQHGAVGTELATSQGSILHFLEGWNTCRLCPELPEGGCCILFSGQDSQSPARCVCQCPHVQHRDTRQDPSVPLPSVSHELISCLLFQIMEMMKRFV